MQLYVRSNGRFFTALAMLFLATSLRAGNLTAPAAFEESVAPFRYSWRSSGVLARFEAGGTVLFSSENEPPARLTFPGAAITAEPYGEGPAVPKAQYFVGP